MCYYIQALMLWVDMTNQWQGRIIRYFQRKTYVYPIGECPLWFAHVIGITNIGPFLALIGVIKTVLL